jgi:nitric oxide synthase oxygenase domain/subunit
LELSTRQGDGASLRTHLQRLAKNTGEVDPLLKIEWPKVGRPIWNAFRRLGRAPSMSGLGDITAQEILAHQQLYGVRFSAWELDVIHMFDALVQEHASKQQG